MNEKKIVITGTGRSGTSFLVKLFTAVGMDTGFVLNEEGTLEANDSVKEGYIGHDEDANAGFEIYFPLTYSKERIESLPKVLKSPYASYQLKGLLEMGKIDVECVVVPVRDLSDATQSRVKCGKGKGGQWLYDGPIDFGIQYQKLCYVSAELTSTIVQYDLPVVWLWFPRLLEDSRYCFDKLSAIPSFNSEWKDFIKLHEEVVQKRR